jgi:hypothetical protein
MPFLGPCHHLAQQLLGDVMNALYNMSSDVQGVLEYQLYVVCSMSSVLFGFNDDFRGGESACGLHEICWLHLKGGYVCLRHPVVFMGLISAFSHSSEWVV